jgi:hypothetical protein
MSTGAVASYLFEHSSSREKIIEHLFVSELLRTLWCQGWYRAEVLRAEFDGNGYDLVVECNGIVRHIQLKSTFAGSTVVRWTLNLALASKPSGCAVLLIFDKDDLSFKHIRWIGDPSCGKLPELGTRVGKHRKGNSQGIKLERPNHRVVSLSQFKGLMDMKELCRVLFNLDSKSITVEKAA